MSLCTLKINVISEAILLPQAKIHAAFKIFFFHFYPALGLFIFIDSIQNIILLQIMPSLSCLSKNILVFLQYENACTIRLDLTFNTNT